MNLPFTPITARTLLMCPPTYFNIEYSINPWMDVGRKAQTDVALQQWQTLHEKFQSLGVEVVLIEAQPGLPDMVYIDAGVIHAGKFIPSNFRYPQRQGERQHFINWFRGQGFEIVEIPEDFYFEGHGDTLWSDNKLFFGYGFRSSIEAHHMIEALLGDNVNVIPVELVDSRFYHLDTCFCPLNDQQVYCYPDALSAKARKLLERHVELLPISEADAIKFACNAVVLQDQIVLSKGSPQTSAMLQSIGYTTHEIPMSEFIKGGGACKCLTMPVR